MIERIKRQIKDTIKENIGIENVNVEEPKVGDADLAIPLFSLTKQLGQPINIVFDSISKVLIDSIAEVERTVFVGGFLNIYLKRIEVSMQILNSIYSQKENYGQLPSNGKTVVIDYSSPNIAKSFSVGHLRSTMIGNAIKNIYLKQGYNVIGINHLGDWGTQFGKLLVAIDKWGNDEVIKKNPTDELQKLYVKFHEEAKLDPSLEDEARVAFKKLENNHEESIKIWEWIKDVSIADLDKMYKRLDVQFDSFAGEAFYNDKMDDVVNELDKKGLLKIDQGATIVELDNMPPAIIKKSDGTSLYITRDLAALFYRYNTYHFDKMIYVVGGEQKLHLEQLKAVSQKMGYNFDIEHVNFGLVLYNGKKMSTREGKNAKLSDVIDHAVELAKEAILTKNPNLKDKDYVSEAVGIGAILFNDLKNERHLNYDFNLENMLKFEGQTGPYIQYSGVRIASILRNESLDINSIDQTRFASDHYFEIVKLLSQFPSTIRRACEYNNPAIISRYLIALAQGFNHFYGLEKIVALDEKIKNANLLLVTVIRYILSEGLRLLGIKSLDEM